VEPVVFDPPEVPLPAVPPKLGLEPPELVDPPMDAPFEPPRALVVPALAPLAAEPPLPVAPPEVCPEADEPPLAFPAPKPPLLVVAAPLAPPEPELPAEAAAPVAPPEMALPVLPPLCPPAGLFELEQAPDARLKSESESESGRTVTARRAGKRNTLLVKHAAPAFASPQRG
jgi:hypothetical protein